MRSAESIEPIIVKAQISANASPISTFSAICTIGTSKGSKGWGQIVKLLQLVDSFLLSANQKPPFLL